MEVDGVKVGLPLAATLNGNQTGAFQLSHEFSHPRPAHPHVLGQSVLPWKAGIIVPGIAQKHGVSDFGSRRQFRVLEDEIGDLSEAILEHGIGRVQPQVLLLEDFPDRLHV